jgi:hypothetical protein
VWQWIRRPKFTTFARLGFIRKGMPVSLLPVIHRLCKRLLKIFTQLPVAVGPMDRATRAVTLVTLAEVLQPVFPYAPKTELEI